jgi:hypothetical protein
MAFDPAIYNEELEKGIVPNRDFEVFVYKNIITEEQSKLVYSEVERIKDSFITQDFVGHRAWTFHNEELQKYLTIWMSDVLGEQMILSELSFARYSRKYGYEPKLFPHFDTHEKDGQRITLDIQLNSTTPWAVVVEGESFNLDNNDGLVFSGTQQVHWREKYNFNKSDYCAAIFAHFKYENNRPLSPNQENIMRYWESKYQKESGIAIDPIGLSEHTLNNWGGKDSWEAKVNEVFQEGKQ